MLLIKLFVFVRQKSFDFFHIFGLESVDSEFSNLSVFDYLRTMNREIGSSGWSSMADPFILWISLSYDFPWPPPDFVWIVKKELHDTLNSSAGVFFVPVFISRFHLAESIFDCLICVLHSGKLFAEFWCWILIVCISIASHEFHWIIDLIDFVIDDDIHHESEEHQDNNEELHDSDHICESYAQRIKENVTQTCQTSSRQLLISSFERAFLWRIGLAGKRMWFPTCDALCICVLTRNRNLVSETVPANLWKSFGAICFCLKHTNSISEFHSK